MNHPRERRHDAPASECTRRRLLTGTALGAACLALGLAPVRAEPAPPPTRMPDESAHAPLSAHLKRGNLELPLQGAVAWQIDPEARRYRIELEAWVGVGLIKDFVQISEGVIDDWGYGPERFSDRRLIRRARVTTFERDTDGGGGRIHFPGRAEPAPLLPGTQDRLSVGFQLAALARGAPQRFVPGSEHPIVTASTRAAVPWVFVVQGPSPVEWAGQSLAAIHLIREPRRAGDQRLDAWLLPQAGYLPVRLRLSEEDGDYLDQRMLEIRR